MSSKGKIHSKMNILPSFTHVVPNLYAVILYYFSFCVPLEQMMAKVLFLAELSLHSFTQMYFRALKVMLYCDVK